MGDASGVCMAMPILSRKQPTSHQPPPAAPDRRAARADRVDAAGRALAAGAPHAARHAEQRVLEVEAGLARVDGVAQRGARGGAAHA